MVKAKFFVDIDGKQYTLLELYSLRNRLRDKLLKVDVLEELMTYNTIYSDRQYLMMGVKHQILEQQAALELLKKRSKDA